MLTKMNLNVIFYLFNTDIETVTFFSPSFYLQDTSWLSITWKERDMLMQLLFVIRYNLYLMLSLL